MEADDLLKALGGRGKCQILVYISLCFIYMRGAWHAFAIMFLGGNPGYKCNTNTLLNETLYPDGQCGLLAEKDGVNVSETCLYGYEYGHENFESTILTDAIALITYVMITELFPSEIRTQSSVAASFFWSLGIISLSLIGYFVRDWKHLELLLSLPNLLTLVYIWTLPESIPWMVSNKKVKQLKDTLKSIAKVNNIILPQDLLVQVEEYGRNNNGNSRTPQQNRDAELNEADSGQSQATLVTTNGDEGLCEGKDKTRILDLFRTPNIRRYTLIMFYLWFVNSLGYFGTMFSTPLLHGNIFVNLAMSGAVEIPAIVICILILERVGRRRPLVCFMFLCGVMNIAAVFVPKETESGTDLGPLTIILAMIGKFGITGSYSTVYLMSAEIFPTVVRNQAVGLSSFCENCGSIAAPFIVFGAKNLAQMPLVLFGVLTMIGGVLALFLPETHKQGLPETIDDIEGRKNVHETSRDQYNPNTAGTRL